MTSIASIALVAALAAPLVACGGTSSTGPTEDAGKPDAVLDASSAYPLPGFGTISGTCGVLTTLQLDDTSPRWIAGTIDFGTDRYDDPTERNLLTTGGAEVITDGNAGGNSLYSEVFAFEWLARCEDAILLKTENEIVYDVMGKKADLLVAIDGRDVGVSVTRAVKYPFGGTFMLSDAETLLNGKLQDLQLATSQASAANRWTTQMVIVLAYNAQHAVVAMEAWSTLDAQVRGAAIIVTVVTDGDDMFIYTDK